MGQVRVRAEGEMGAWASPGPLGKECALFVLITRQQAFRSLGTREKEEVYFKEDSAARHGGEARRLQS